MREILHFQLGNKSNYVGTHLWNSLSLYFENGNELIDEDVLYRKGEFKEILNYTPRLISVDLKGAKQMGAGLYSEGDIENQPVYNTLPLKINRNENQKNNYQKDLELVEEDQLDLEEMPKTYSEHLTETTKMWSDFNSCYYHPLTWNEIEAYTHESTSAKFVNFSQGVDVFDDQEYGFDLMEDKVRKFMEQCDSPQGFQILADADNAFSGFTHSLLQDLGQEYVKKTAMVYSLSKSSSNQSMMGKINQSLLLKSGEDEGVVYIPIKLPSQSDLNVNYWSKYLSPHFDTLYQQSGYIAAAIHNISLPMRLSDSHKRMDMQQLQQMLDYHSSSTCAISFGFPPLNRKMNTLDVSALFGKSWDWARNLTLETHRADFLSAAKTFNAISGISECVELKSSREMQDIIQSRLDFSLSNLFINDSAFLVSKSFPQFFTKSIATNGVVVEEACGGGYVEKLSLATNLSSGPNINLLYEDSLNHLKAFTRYGSTIPGFEKVEIAEIIEYFEAKLPVS